MKNQMIAIATILLTTIFIASCGSKGSESKNPTTEQTANAMYQCPMKCESEKVYDKTGQCPVCNMELEKVVGNHDHHKHDSLN